VAPTGEMPTADGWLNVSGVKQEHYEALCRAIGRPDLIVDPSFRTNADRLARAGEIIAIVQAEFRKKTTAEWCAILTEAGVMHAAVADYGDFLANEHVRAVEAVVMADQPGVGPVPHANVPGAPPIDPAAPLARAPRVGEHGAEILIEAGYGESEIAALLGKGAAAG
ncbi:MAG: CoA transferase, partial [Hyphomicrobiales bacterium]|nr:CoA transferase [Hyphomicrobiales bacterium]